MKKKKWEMPKRGSASGMGKALAIGTGISVALTLGLSALFAALMDRQALPQEMTGTLAMVILAVSAAVGAWSSAKLAGSRSMVVCLLLGGCYILLLFAATAFFFGGKYQGIPVTAALIFGACAAAGIVGAGEGRGESVCPKSTGSVNMTKS